MSNTLLSNLFKPSKCILTLMQKTKLQTHTKQVGNSVLQTSVFTVLYGRLKLLNWMPARTLKISFILISVWMQSEFLTVFPKTYYLIFMLQSCLMNWWQDMYCGTPLQHHIMPTTNISVKAELAIKWICYVWVHFYLLITNFPVMNDRNLQKYLKTTNVLKCVTKQHMKTKIITYLPLLNYKSCKLSACKQVLLHCIKVRGWVKWKP
jgi:hypothetical protein